MNRVVFVINSLEGGGAERILALLVRETEKLAATRNFCVSLILLDDCPVVQELPDHIDLHVLHSNGSLIKSCTRLFFLLRQMRPQVVVSFLTRSNCAAVLAARGLGVPVVISERVNTSSHFGRGAAARLNRIMVRTIYPRADRVVAVSGGVARDLRQNYAVREERLVTIYNAYDSRRLKALANESDVSRPEGDYLCAMGRLVPNKNFELLIRAYHRSAITLPLLILGQGPQEAALRALSAALGLQDQVQFVGFRQNPYPLLSGCSFFISSSNAEGFPNALAESMVLGKAVISTNCESGPSEVLADECELQVDRVAQCRHGILVPVNDVDNLARAMQLMMDPETRARYEEASSARAKDFSVNNFVLSYLDVIQSHFEIEAHKERTV